jgi:hypothetical protein
MKDKSDYHISEYNYIGSAIGNAYFSGVSFDQLWECVAMAENREQLDVAVEATILLNELQKIEKNT